MSVAAVYLSRRSGTKADDRRTQADPAVRNCRYNHCSVHKFSISLSKSALSRIAEANRRSAAANYWFATADTVI
jgi:hypothetical protein